MTAGLQLDARVQKEKKTISVVSLSASLLDLQNELDTADPNAVTTRGRSRPLSSRARKHVVYVPLFPSCPCDEQRTILPPLLLLSLRGDVVVGWQSGAVVW